MCWQWQTILIGTIKIKFYMAHTVRRAPPTFLTKPSHILEPINEKRKEIRKMCFKEK